MYQNLSLVGGRNKESLNLTDGALGKGNGPIRRTFVEEGGAAIVILRVAVVGQRDRRQSRDEDRGDGSGGLHVDFEMVESLNGMSGELYG